MKAPAQNRTGINGLQNRRFTFKLKEHILTQRERDSNPRVAMDKRFSRPSRYNHFDTSANGVRRIRTFAPITRPSSLANCPLHHLGMTPKQEGRDSDSNLWFWRSLCYHCTTDLLCPCPIIRLYQWSEGLSLPFHLADTSALLDRHHAFSLCHTLSSNLGFSSGKDLHLTWLKFLALLCLLQIT